MSAVPNESGWAKKFSRWTVASAPNSEGEIAMCCPIHEEPGASKPSASMNPAKGKFICFASCGGMSLSALWSIVREDASSEASASRSPRSSVTSLDGARERKRGKAALPTDARLNSFHEALKKSPSMLKMLSEERGIGMDVIERYRLGWNEDRVQIPILSKGELVNVRRYKPKAKTDKVIGIMGHNETHIFPESALEEEEMILCEGEMDTLCAISNGFNAITQTGGAKRFPPYVTELFKDKVVFICYDNDDAGKGGSIKAALELRKVARSVHVIRLPLTGKGEDLTDYFVNHGYTPNEFRKLMEEARKEEFAEREFASRVGAEAKLVTLEGSMSADLKNDPVEIVVSVAGKVQPSYLLPRKVNFMCDQDFGTKCNKCEMHLLHSGSTTKEIARDNPVLLELIDANKARSDSTLAKEIAGAPPTCPRLVIDEEERWNVEELVVVPSVEARDEQTQTPISRRVYNVGEYATPINTVSRVVGVNTTDPRSRRAAFQAWECEQTQTNLDRFAMTEDLRQSLKVFRPAEGQKPLQKMGEIARDLEANVTRIYGRAAMHMAYDLVWHSVMDFKFKGVPQGKGWLELLVLGDTRTGKSEAALRLTDHYQAGVLKSCEGATLAGLVGGAQQVGSSWMITWGTIPLNDRRLVVLDEVSGIKDRGIIDQMSAVRSSGRAQITKIVSQETSARTRLIWISNPPDGRTVKEMSKGAIESIQQLIPNPEDIARFDIAMSAASEDVDSSLINSSQHAQVKHVYTQDLCSALVSWAWSRRIEDVTWKPGVEDLVLKTAEIIGHSYIPEPPLIQPENVRVKLARLAVAIACRVFSTDKTGEKVVVRKEHVEAASEFLDAIYGMKSFGYKDFSVKTIRNRQRAEANVQATRKYLINNEDVLRALLACLGGDFKVRDFEDFAGMTRDEAQVAVQDLMKLRNLRRMSKGYIRMENSLVHILKELEDVLDE